MDVVIFWPFVLGNAEEPYIALVPLEVTTYNGEYQCVRFK